MSLNEIESNRKIFQRAVFEAPSAIIIYNKEGKVVFVNKAASEAIKFEVNDFPNLTSWIKETNPEAKSGEKFKNGVYTLKSKNGDLVNWNCHFDNLDDESESFYILRAQDVTQLIKSLTSHTDSLEQLRLSELSFKRLVESNIIGITIGDFDGNYIEANDAFLKIVGYTREDFDAGIVQWDKMTPEDQIQQDYIKIEEAKKKGACPPFEKHFIKKNGKLVPVLLGFALMPGTQNNCVAFALDLSTQKETETALKKSEANLKAIFNSSHQAFVLLDDNYRLLAFNKLAEEIDIKILGKKLVEGKDYREYISTENTNSFIQNYTSALNGKNVKIERKVKSQDEQELWFEFNYAPVYAEENRVIGVSLSILNINDRKKATIALLESEKRFKSLVQNSSDIITVVEQNGKIIYESPSIKGILGYEPEVFIGKDANAYIHPEDLKSLEKAFIEAYREDENLSVEYRVKHANGEWIYIESVVSNLLNDPIIKGIVINSRDVSARKKAEADLYETQRLIQGVVDATPNIVYLHDSNENKVLYVNQAIKNIVEYSADYIIDNNITFYNNFVHPEDISKRENSKKLLATAKQNEVVETEYRIKDANGLWKWIYNREIVFSRNEDGSPNQILGTIEDISKRKLMEEQLRKEAYYDSLTGLAKGKLFIDKLKTAMDRKKRDPSYYFIVAFLDIDRFKIINDSLGHTSGDKLLVDIANRLQKCLGEHDTIARLGGDEFTILFEGVKDLEEVIIAINKIQKKLNQPFKIKKYSVSVTSSIGITPANISYTNPEDMLRDADTAMYRAKNKGKNCYEVFSSSMHTQMVKLLEIEADIRRALRNDEFELYYQPVVNIKTGKVVGCEALTRWNDPKKGIILSPGEFLPIAEETGLITEIDKWALYTACKQNIEWQKMGISPIQVAVNLSFKQLTEKQVLKNVIQVIESTSLDPKYLELELTENVFIENTESTIDIFYKLKEMGIKLLIDDFGTGYSSLTYLQRLPINGLKIDQLFIRNMTKHSQNMAVTKAIISLAHNFNLKVIAEGVETKNQFDILSAQSCDEVQGFLFSKPIPAKDFKEYLIKSSKPN